MDKHRWLLLALILLALAQQAGARTAVSGPGDRFPNAIKLGRRHDTSLQATASFQESTISIPTYPFAAHLTLVHNPTYNIIYPVLNWSSYLGSQPAPSAQDYTLLVLENDYLRVTVLPELGGRVYQMIYKATGSNELYQNPVLKPTHWGSPEQGWWLAAGGIEWGLPVEEHGYEWGTPWSWSAITTTRGVTVTLRDTTASDRLRVAVGLFLPSDRGYLEAATHLENPTADSVTFKYWNNALLAPGPQNSVTEGLEFVMNSPTMVVHSTSDSAFPCAGQNLTTPSCLFSWPLYAGQDFSRLGNWREWLGFFEYPQAAADFVGVYNHDAGEGVARIFPSATVRGAKVFAFGWSNPIDWHYWTDDGSTYVELHGGVAPTFWDTATLNSGQTLFWSETWYPVGDIGTLSAATPQAALGVRQLGGNVQIGVHSTVARPAHGSTLYAWEQSTCSELGRWELSAIDPATPFQVSFPSGGRSLDQVTVAYYDGQENLLAAVNETDCLPPRAWVNPLPSWVASPTVTVSWTGQDNDSGIATYDVQVRDGYEGNWTDWQVGTTAISHTFAGLHGHTTYFRARASDAAGNQGPFGDEEWGQASTTILTSPAPVLVNSNKTASPQRFTEQTVDYIITIRNSGSLTGSILLTDTLPAWMVLLSGTLAVSSGGAPISDSGQIRWSGTASPGSEITLSYTLSPTAETPMGIPLTNTVQIAGSVLGPLTRYEVVRRVSIYWLPYIMRGWSS